MRATGTSKTRNPKGGCITGPSKDTQDPYSQKDQGMHADAGVTAPARPALVKEDTCGLKAPARPLPTKRTRGYMRAQRHQRDLHWN
jgi:hypothetical protein